VEITPTPGDIAPREIILWSDRVRGVWDYGLVPVFKFSLDEVISDEIFPGDYLIHGEA